MHTYRVDISPICLRLWMLKRIPIYLTCAGKQEAGSNSFCQTQHVQCPHHICLVQINIKENFKN